MFLRLEILITNISGVARVMKLGGGGQNKRGSREIPIGVWGHAPQAIFNF